MPIVAPGLECPPVPIGQGSGIYIGGVQSLRMRSAGLESVARLADAEPAQAGVLGRYKALVMSGMHVAGMVVPAGGPVYAADTRREPVAGVAQVPPVGWKPFECLWQIVQSAPVLWPWPVESLSDRWWAVTEWQTSQMPKPVSGPKPYAPVKFWKLTALPFITFLMSIILFELCVVWQSRHSVAGSSVSVCRSAVVDVYRNPDVTYTRSASFYGSRCTAPSRPTPSSVRRCSKGRYAVYGRRCSKPCRPLCMRSLVPEALWCYSGHWYSRTERLPRWLLVTPVPGAWLAASDTRSAWQSTQTALAVLSSLR